MKAVTYKFTGMNNVDDPVDVGKPDPRSKALVFTECVEIVNADPDNSGGCSLREGQGKVYVGNIHSGWSNPYNPQEEFFVEGTVLKRRWPDGNASVIRPGLSLGRRMAFCQVNDVVTYSNGIERGVIESGLDVVPFVPTDPFKLPMVAGQCLEWYNGRLYALKDNVLYCSDSLDVPGGIESMDERQNVVAVFDGPGTMLQRVDDGLFVSAGKETFFFQGTDAIVGGFDQRSIAPYPAVLGTNCPVKADLLGIEGLAGNACMWASKRYICVGGNGGFFTYQDKLALKPGREGTAVVREKNGTAHYLVNLRDLGTEHNAFVPRTITVD